MSSSVPGSREALFALLREMARSEHAAPEQLADARHAIEQGHLGPVSEAFVEDRDGRPIPLLAWAVSLPDVEMVKLLLDSGATPLAAERTRESVLRAAHRDGPGPLVQLVRRAAREASEGASTALHGLATSSSERRYALRTERGVRDLRRTADGSRKLDVLLVACELKTVARALATLVQAPRREADVAHRPVPDAARLVFLYRLRGIDWTIVPFVFEPASPWNVEHVTELAAAGSGIASMARALAGATASRVIHVEYDGHTVHTEYGGVEARRSDDAMDDAIDDAIDELAELGAFVPPMRVSTDGYHVQLELVGLEPSDVERVDVVALQELGDPRVERTIALGTAAPAMVGAPVLLAPGVPALVQPAAVEAPASAGSEAPPLVREPPPIVTQAGPAASEAPPMMREPPPLIAGATTSERPPLASEPPASAAPTKSAPPPLVHEPPAMVVPAASEVPAELDPAAGALEPDARDET